MNVLVIAQSADELLSTRQAVSAAQHWGGAVDVLVFDTQAKELARISGLRAVLCSAARPVAEDASRVINQLAGDYQVVLAAHGSFSRNVLPRVAALRDVGMVSDALALLGPTTYQRPIYAGNLVSRVENRAGLQVVSVRASRFASAPLEGAADVVALPAIEADARCQMRGVKLGEGPDLRSARVVVSGGRSLGSAEQFLATLSPLASRLGAALGATRAAADAGFAPNEWQVGQTGTTVAPDLYIAIGLSGAQQHLAGMKDSKVVVAINQDADAPIMKFADYTLVADLFDAVPALTKALSQQGQ